MKNPLVPWTWRNVSRNWGKRGWAYRGHRTPRDRLVLVGIDRADGVDDRPAGLHPRRRGAQERELEFRERGRTPAQIGSLPEDAEAGAGRVDEGPVEAVELGRQFRP